MCLLYAAEALAPAAVSQHLLVNVSPEHLACAQPSCHLPTLDLCSAQALAEDRKACDSPGGLSGVTLVPIQPWHEMGAQEYTSPVCFCISLRLGIRDPVPPPPY